MSTALTVAKLPAHLQAMLGNSALSTMNADATKGISAGSWPKISIKGGNFRLQDPQGQEILVPDRFLDVVLVAVNPHGLSKKWYKGAYDPKSEPAAPDCYSDNGVAPSVKSTNPQCGTCAACPHNVWGSKVTPNGAQVKACADVKKVAVLLANNTSGAVFELDIPAASLSNFGAYIRGLDGAGIPAASIVTRLTFDTTADYPKLLFGTPVLQEGQSPYITPDMLADVMDVLGSDEVKQATGENDRPIDGLKVGAAAATVIAQQPLPAHLAAPQPAYPQPLAAQQAVAEAPAPAVRTRRKKADAAPVAALPVPQAMENARAVPQAMENARAVPQAMENAPAWLKQSAPATGRDAQAPINVAATDPQLDALLAAAMRV